MTISYNSFSDDDNNTFMAVAVEIKEKGKCRVTAVTFEDQEFDVKKVKAELKSNLDKNVRVLDSNTISCDMLTLTQLCLSIGISLSEKLSFQVRNRNRAFQMFICDAFSCFDNEFLEKMLGEKLPPELVAQRGMPLNTKGDEVKNFDSAEYFDKASAPGGLPAKKRWGRQK